jgi:hypothetical protein
MPRNSVGNDVEMVTFRVDRTLKLAIAEIAQKEAKPVGGLLRELVRERVEEERRREFRAQARRQSLEAAAAARDPQSEEAAILRELEAGLEDRGDEWG